MIGQRERERENYEELWEWFRVFTMVSLPGGPHQNLHLQSISLLDVVRIKVQIHPLLLLLLPFFFRSSPTSPCFGQHLFPYHIDELVTINYSQRYGSRKKNQIHDQIITVSQGIFESKIIAFVMSCRPHAFIFPSILKDYAIYTTKREIDQRAREREREGGRKRTKEYGGRGADKEGEIRQRLRG